MRACGGSWGGGGAKGNGIEGFLRPVIFFAVMSGEKIVASG